MKKTTCIQCLSSKQYMVPKATKGFEYKECNLCDSNGMITEELLEDFTLSQNEDLIEDYE